MDARRCISYLTIELRGSIPQELREAMGMHVFGCDICQDVCPWNREAPATSNAAFLPRAIASEDGTGRSLLMPELEWLARLNEEEFHGGFRESAVRRAKWRGLVRNACVALGNSRQTRGSANYERVLTLLKRLAMGDDEMIAEHAKWALARLEAASRT
jgi:epoxyqueuosine reductase